MTTPSLRGDLDEAIHSSWDCRANARNDGIPLVSIIMNCFNGEEYLREAIDSIYKQSYQNWEIIFIDNCSTDSSAEIAKSYDERLKYFQTDKTIELGATRNVALKNVTGKYVCFLDTDDFWLSNKLNAQVRLLEKNERCALCYGGVYFINEQGSQISKLKPQKRAGFLIPSLLEKYDINMQTVMLRYNKDYCFIDESKEFSPDFELFMRVACDYDVTAMDEYLVNCRRRSDSLTHKKISRWWVEHQETIDMVLKKLPELVSTHAKSVRRGRAKVAYYKARYYYSEGKNRLARDELKQAKSAGKNYFALYLLSRLPVFFWNKVHASACK